MSPRSTPASRRPVTCSCPATNIAGSGTARCWRRSRSCRPNCSGSMRKEERPVASLAERAPAAPRWRKAAAAGELGVRRLVLAHVWVAIAAFAVACLLGVWQMWARSPLEAPAHTASNYFRSVTLHGVSMAFVLTTFFIMGFGYFTAETSLGRPLPAIRLAWTAFWMGLAGTLMAALSVISGHASVLYTFYPPMTATVWFYLGLVLVVVGSWLLCLLMI